MEDLLLIHLPDTPEDGSKPVFTPPIGLWSMRSNSGYWYSVQVIDMNIQELQQTTTETVGYSLMFPGHIKYLNSARRKVKARRELLGGPTGSQLFIFPMTTIIGPGEHYLLGRTVPFKDLNCPHFLSYEMEPYWIKGSPFSGIPSSKRWMPVETSRGCPNKCGFCAIPSLWGPWQARPIDVLDRYFRYLVEIHGIEEIIVIDDNVAVSIDRFLSIIDLFKKYSLSWSIANGIYNRALLNPEVINAIKGSKCLYLSLPFEAGNPNSAALMNLGKKYLTEREALEVTKTLQDLGIETAGQFIIGYPGETEDDVKATLQYANSLPLGQRHIHMAMPLPNTPMFATCQENYYLKEAGKNYKTPTIETPTLSRERLKELWTADREAALKRKESL